MNRIEPQLIAEVPNFTTRYLRMDKARIWETRYLHDPEVVALLITDDGYQPELACKATVYLDAKPAPGHVLIKDYGENEGVRAALEAAGIIGPALATLPAGWAEVTEHELLKRANVTNSVVRR